MVKSWTARFGGIGFWGFFTGFLACLQGWVLVGTWAATGDGKGDPRQMLRDGSIIFFANALAMKAIEEKCYHLWNLIRKKDQGVFDFFSIVFRRLCVGAVVLVSSVTLYLSLLFKASDSGARPPGNLEIMEIMLLLVALSLSMFEATDNERRRQVEALVSRG